MFRTPRRRGAKIVLTSAAETGTIIGPGGLCVNRTAPPGPPQERPLMYQPLIRLHKSFPAVVTVCLLSLPLLQAGCEGDVDAADKQVRQQLSEGAQKTDAAVTSAPTVPAAYKQAAGVTKASPAVRVEALLRLAEAERDRALALMSEADQLDTDFYRLVGAVNRQTGRVKSNNTLIAGLTQLNPTQAQQAIQ